MAPRLQANEANQSCTTTKARKGGKAEMKRPSAARPGSKNGNAKLTEEQIRAIRESDKMVKALAYDYGVCRQTISRIRKGEMWGHLA